MLEQNLWQEAMMLGSSARSGPSPGQVPYWGLWKLCPQAIARITGPWGAQMSLILLLPVGSENST